MRQVWVTGPGGPEVLEVRELPDPHAGPGEVRISVHAAGVNFADVLARAGLYPDAPKPPTVLGYEVAGEIDEVGADVQGFTEGDRSSPSLVWGLFERRRRSRPPSEGFASRQGSPAGGWPTRQLPHRLPDAQPSRVGPPGEWVLIHAAAGGVGVSALQLCKKVGAVTVDTARAWKHERLRQRSRPSGRLPRSGFRS